MIKLPVVGGNNAMVLLYLGTGAFVCVLQYDELGARGRLTVLKTDFTPSSF